MEIETLSGFEHFIAFEAFDHYATSFTMTPQIRLEFEHFGTFRAPQARNCFRLAAFQVLGQDFLGV